MTNDEFLDIVRSIFYTELKKLNKLTGEWHLGKVNSVISPYVLSVFVDGSTSAQNIPCNPNIIFNKDEEVWVHYINGNPMDKFVPYKRATGNQSTIMGVGNISMLAGNSKQLIVSIVDQNNNPVDLTSMNVQWVLKDSTNTVILSKTVGNGITITNATQGQCTITISSSDSKNLLGTYTHQASIIDSQNNSSVVFVGTIVVNNF